MKSSSNRIEELNLLLDTDCTSAVLYQALTHFWFGSAHDLISNDTLMRKLINHKSFEASSNISERIGYGANANIANIFINHRTFDNICLYQLLFGASAIGNVEIFKLLLDYHWKLIENIIKKIMPLIEMMGNRHDIPNKTMIIDMFLKDNRVREILTKDEIDRYESILGG